MDFLEELESRVMVAFGAMSIELKKGGYSLSDNYLIWAVEHPDEWRDFLKACVDHGADILPAGGSPGNRFRLKHLGLEDQAFRLTRDGVKLGREVCPPNCYLSGLLGNLGQLLQPLGDINYEEAYESYKEQVMAMAEAGVDLVWILTMTDLPAMEAAIRAVKDNTNLPVIASMSFDPTPKGPKTMMGVNPKEVSEKLDQAGADVIGANCGGVSSAQVADILKDMTQVTNKMLVAKPNAGKPEVINDEMVYPVSPEEMASHVPEWIANGARIVGGCCGASVEHVARIAETVRQISKK